MKPIFLVGFTAVGKTTVGKALAERLGQAFIDTDLFIEWRYNSSVEQMFESCGVEKFRKREKVVLIELSLRQNTVIATGGGLATYSDNMELMKQRGTVIYLQASPTTLAERLYLVRQSRPAVAGKDKAGVQNYVEELLPKRTPIYQQAHHTVSAEELTTEADVAKLVEQIVALLG